MPDREKVIKGLHCCSHTDGVNCIYCPYDNTDSDCTALMSMDVLELLKEQEPKPIAITTNEYGTKFYHCPNCNKTFYEPWELYKDYCYNCGQAVKWE